MSSSRSRNSRSRSASRSRSRADERDGAAPNRGTGNQGRNTNNSQSARLDDADDESKLLDAGDLSNDVDEAASEVEQMEAELAAAQKKKLEALAERKRLLAAQLAVANAPLPPLSLPVATSTGATPPGTPPGHGTSRGTDTPKVFPSPSKALNVDDKRYVTFLNEANFVPRQLTSTIKLTSTDKFETYRSELFGYLKMSAIAEFLEMPSDEHWLLVQRRYGFDGTGPPGNDDRTYQALYNFYRVAHQKISGMLELSVSSVLSDCPVVWTQIANEQPAAYVETPFTTGATYTGLFVKDNANLLWRKIEQMFDRKTNYSFVVSFKALLGMKYIDGTDPQAFMNGVEAQLAKIDKIASTEAPLPGRVFNESIRAALTVMLLPPSCAYVVNHLCTNGKDRMCTKDISDILMSKYQVKVMKNAVASSDHSAHYTGGATSGTSTSSSKRPGGDKKKGWRRPADGTSGGRSLDRIRGDHVDTSDEHVAWCGIDDQDEEEEKRFQAAQDAEFHSDVEVGSDDDDTAYHGNDDELGAYDFIFDTGCTKHICNNIKLLKDVRDCYPFNIHTAGSQALRVTQTGSVGLIPTVTLHNVAYCPKATANLISGKVIIDANFEVLMTKDYARVVKANTNKKIIDFTRRRDGLFGFRHSASKSVKGHRVDFDFTKEPVSTSSTTTAKSNSNTNGDRKSAAPTASKAPVSTNSRQELAASRAASAASAAGAAKAAGHKANYATHHPEEKVLVATKEASSATSVSVTNCNTAPGTYAAKLVNGPANLIHQRFAHQTLKKDKLKVLGVTGGDHAAACHCQVCALTKMRRKRTGKGTYLKASGPLECLGLDLLGPASYKSGDRMVRLPATTGETYALVAVDQYAKYVWVVLLHSKSQVPEAIKTLLANIRTQFGVTVKTIHTDGGTEFVNGELKVLYQGLGVNHTYTTPNSPMHNGQAERMIGTLTTMVRSMLVHANLNSKLWGEALVYAAYIRNRTPVTGVLKAPLELLTGKSTGTASISKIKVFGSNAYVKKLNTTGKFEPVSAVGVFVGVNVQQNSYKVLVDNGTRTVSTRDATFQENVFTNAVTFGLKTTGSELRNARDNESTGQLNVESSADIDDNLVQFGDTADVVDISDDTEEVEAVQDSQVVFDADDLSIPALEDPDFSIEDDVEPLPLELSIIQEEDESSDAADTSTVATGLDTEASEGADSTVLPASSITSHLNVIDSPLPTNRYGRTLTRATQYGMVSPLDIDPAERHYTRYGVDRDEIAMFTTDDLVDYGMVTSKKRDVALSAKHYKSGPNYVAGGLIEPQTYRQAVNGADATTWQKSMTSELAALHDQQVLELVPKPPKVKLLSTRWVYKIKLDEHNKPIKYKSRLVVRGFMQEKGINYQDTFAPVAKFKSIKMLLALAAVHDLELKQIDFDTAFLNALLAEDVYISIPDGLESNATAGMCYKLRKALYGLKQAPSAWNSTLHDTLVSLGYKNTSADPCVYYKYNKSSKVPIILCVYVDDTIAGYHKSLQSIWYKDKAAIAAKYPIKDIGDVQWVLNMEVTRDRAAGTITLNQGAYIRKVLEEHQMVQVRTATNPQTGVDLTDPRELEADAALGAAEHSKYRAIVGQICYAANTTRIDISFVANVLSRYVSAPKSRHLVAAKNVLRYLAGTTDYGMTFTSTSTTGYQLSVYSDADWASDKSDRRSTTGAVILFNGNIISWVAKKQATVALSSTEAEYMAITKAGQELAWYQTWMKEVLKVTVTAPLFTDNKSAEHLCRNDGYHQRTKHIDIRHHWIREQLTSGAITVHWVPTTEQLADILTKRLGTAVFTHLRDQLLSDLST